jgi:hypothetical protein
MDFALLPLGFKFWFIFTVWSGCQAALVFEGKEATLELKGVGTALLLRDQLQNITGRIKIPDDASPRINAELIGQDSLVFAAGRLDMGAGDLTLTGSFLSGNGSPFYIGDQGELNLVNQTFPMALTVAAGHTATISGTPTFAAPISLESSTSELRCRIASKLDQNINLNFGKVVLENDLTFKDANFFVGSGTVDINNKTLFAPAGNKITGILTFLNARDMQFTGDQTIDAGIEQFVGVGLTSLVNGNGYTWDIINSGKIQVGPDHTLYLTDVRIKDLGSSSSYGFFDIDVTSTIVLSNATLELSDNYTHGAGTISVEGDRCFVIPHGHSFTVQNGQTRLRVDGVALSYRLASVVDSSPFVFVDLSQHEELVNDGTIRAASRVDDFRLFNISATPTTLTKHLKLSGLETLSFINTTPGTPNPMVFDGSGFSVTFPDQGGGYLNLDPNVQLTLQNVVLEDFNPAVISYGNAASKIIFGDGVVIKLAQDLSIGENDSAWNFSGDATIVGNNCKLSLDGDARLVLTSNNNLTLQGVQLEIWRPDAISVGSSGAKITFKDSKIILPHDGLVLKNGNVDIEGTVTVEGVNKSFWQSPDTEQLLARANNLGLGLFAGFATPTSYVLGVADVAAQNGTLTLVRVDKAGSAFYSESIDPYAATWRQIPGSFGNIGIGADGQIWVVATDNSVQRVSKGVTPTLTPAPGATGNFIAVGSADYLYLLDANSGNVYCNTDPAAVIPGNWVAVPEASGARAIAADSQGTLWFIAAAGQVYKKLGSQVELVYEGTGLDLQAIKVSGSGTRYLVALLSSAASGGRVIVSQDGGPFKDLGLFKVADLGIGVNGSLLCSFDSSLVAEDPTFGRPLYFKFNYQNTPLLCMDQALSFSSTGNLTIKSGATLKLTDNTTFNYQADPLGSGFWFDSKRHLLLEDQSATLQLKNATLALGGNGLALTQGKLSLEGQNFILASAESGAALELSRDLQVKLPNNSELNLLGPVAYSSDDQMVIGTAAIGPVAANFADSLDPSVLAPQWAAAEARGFAVLGQDPQVFGGTQYPGWEDRGAHNNWSVSLVSGLPTGYADRVYKVNNSYPQPFELELSAADPSFVVDSQTLDTVFFSQISVGTDGICAGVSSNSPGLQSIDGIFRFYSSEFAAGGENLGLAGARVVSIGSQAQLYALQWDGSVVKWNPNGNWDPVDLGVATGARYVAAGEDGTLWFIDDYGDLKVKDPVSGQISDFPGGNRLDLMLVRAAGNRNDFKLVALDQDGKLYSAETTRALEYEGFSLVHDATVAKSGLCCVVFAVDYTDINQVYAGGRTYIGWIKNRTRAGWPYPR